MYYYSFVLYFLVSIHIFPLYFTNIHRLSPLGQRFHQINPLTVNTEQPSNHVTHLYKAAITPLPG